MALAWSTFRLRRASWRSADRCLRFVRAKPRPRQDAVAVVYSCSFKLSQVQEALDLQQEKFAKTEVNHPVLPTTGRDLLLLIFLPLNKKMRQETFRIREENLRKHDLELQESLIKFNKFLQVSLFP